MMLLYSTPKKEKSKKKRDTRWKAKVRIGINVSIICIETLFLAEYCAFGWVVGTFFWVFWFCFAIAWKFAGGRRRPSASSDPPANFQAIAKKIKISEKSANYQPNPQYQPKKRHYLYNISGFYLKKSQVSKNAVNTPPLRSSRGPTFWLVGVFIANTTVYIVNFAMANK